MSIPFRAKRRYLHSVPVSWQAAPYCTRASTYTSYRTAVPMVSKSLWSLNAMVTSRSLKSSHSSNFGCFQALSFLEIKSILSQSFFSFLSIHSLFSGSFVRCYFSACIMNKDASLRSEESLILIIHSEETLSWKHTVHLYYLLGLHYLLTQISLFTAPLRGDCQSPQITGNSLSLMFSPCFLGERY